MVTGKNQIKAPGQRADRLNHCQCLARQRHNMGLSHLGTTCEYLTPSMGSRDAGIVQIARSISSSSQRMKRNSLERTKVSNVNRTASTVSRRPLYPCSLRRKSGISCSGNAECVLAFANRQRPRQISGRIAHQSTLFAHCITHDAVDALPHCPARSSASRCSIMRRNKQVTSFEFGNGAMANRRKHVSFKPA